MILTGSGDCEGFSFVFSRPVQPLGSSAALCGQRTAHRAAMASSSSAWEPDVPLSGEQLGNKRRRASWVPDGPSSLEELLDWPAQLWQQILDRDAAENTDLASRIKSAVMQGITLTTTYSGQGGAETACSMICEHVAAKLKAAGLEPVGLCVYSATELESSCQQVLQAHSCESRPRHVFNTHDVHRSMRTTGNTMVFASSVDLVSN